MGKLIFALFVLVVGLGVYGAIRRRPNLLPGGFGELVPRTIMVVAIGVPALVFLLSIFRVIPAGQVGVKVLFGQVDPSPLREGLNVLWNPLYEIVPMDVRVLKHTARYDAASKDLQAVHVEMVLNYRVVADRAPEVSGPSGSGTPASSSIRGPRRSSRPTPRPTTPPRSS